MMELPMGGHWGKTPAPKMQTGVDVGVEVGEEEPQKKKKPKTTCHTRRASSPDPLAPAPASCACTSTQKAMHRHVLANTRAAVTPMKPKNGAEEGHIDSAMFFFDYHGYLPTRTYRCTSAVIS